MKALAIALIALALTSDTRGRLFAATGDQSNPCTRPPVVQLAVAPGFPDLPWKARIGADQWVQVEVNESGDVVKAVMEAEMNPSLGFGNAAVVAARRWKFEAIPGCPARSARLMFRFVMPVTKSEQVGVQFKPPYEVDVAVLAISVDVRVN